MRRIIFNLISDSAEYVFSTLSKEFPGPEENMQRSTESIVQKLGALSPEVDDAIVIRKE